MVSETKPPEKNRSLVKKENVSLPSLGKKANLLAEAILSAGSKGRENIPNASLIYGIASAVLFAISLYYLFTGTWFNGFLIFVLGAAMFGYALHFLQNPD